LRYSPLNEVHTNLTQDLDYYSAFRSTTHEYAYRYVVVSLSYRINYFFLKKNMSLCLSYSWIKNWKWNMVAIVSNAGLTEWKFVHSKVWLRERERERLLLELDVSRLHTLWLACLLTVWGLWLATDMLSVSVFAFIPVTLGGLGLAGVRLR